MSAETVTGDRYLCGQAHLDVFRVTCWAVEVDGCGGGFCPKVRREYVGLTAALIHAQRWLATGADARVKIKRVVR